MAQTVKAWYFTPEEKNIKVIDFPVESNIKLVYKLLDCNVFDIQSTHDPISGLFLGIFMDDEGLLKREVYCESASKCLGRININWGNMKGGSYAYLGGKYIAFAEKERDDGERERVSFPADFTPRLFIERFNKGLEERVRRQAEFFKSFGKERVEVITYNPPDLGLDNAP
jgi:hypothetical protein